MKEINTMFTMNQNFLRQQSLMKTLFLLLSPKLTKGATAVSVEIWPLRGFFTVSLILVDLHPDKIHPFCWCQECQICIKNLGPK